MQWIYEFTAIAGLRGVDWQTKCLPDEDLKNTRRPCASMVGRQRANAQQSSNFTIGEGGVRRGGGQDGVPPVFRNTNVLIKIEHTR